MNNTKKLNINNKYMLNQSINALNSFCILNNMFITGFDAKTVLKSQMGVLK